MIVNESYKINHSVYTYTGNDYEGEFSFRKCDRKGFLIAENRGHKFFDDYHYEIESIKRLSKQYPDIYFRVIKQ